MKPQLANDAVISAVSYPTTLQPKIDGVRALNISGTLTGRSLDPFKGFGITEYWSKPEFQYLDGEMTLGPNPASSERLCNLTTGALGAFKGVTEMADVYLHCFDWLAEPDLPYAQRYAILKGHIEKLDHPRVKLVPSYVANNREELDALVAKFFDDGYEGAIIRNPRSRLKEGRPTKEGQLWRIKGWMDSEMLVTGFTEGQTNTNEAKTNTLGRTERSSAKDGMVPNGMVGSIHGTLIGDCFHPITGAKIFPDGLPITIGTGSMTDAELLDYFKHPEKLVGHTIKFKHLAHGTKDLPRMGNYLSHRLKEDM